MKPSFILPVFLFAFLSAKEDDDKMPCCPKKIVGGKTYMLAGKLDKMEAMKYKCSSPCLYTMAGSDDKKFCFKPGSQESKCAMNSTGMPNFSRTSPMPGFSTTAGGSRPPMTTGGAAQTTGGSGGSGGLYAPPDVWAVTCTQSLNLLLDWNSWNSDSHELLKR